ncbi:MAG: shikimate dehydrogenase [Acidimicrobiales bacterium]
MSGGPGEPASWVGLSAATTVVGVIGHPVAHSLSPLLHNAAFEALGIDWVSVGFPVLPGALAPALAGMRALGVRGLSVTMPHKEGAWRLVDRRTAVADRLEAVNCVTNEAGTLTGTSTDGAGLLDALATRLSFDPAGKRCLVVGGGGAGRAVVAALRDAGAVEIVVVNRTPSGAARAVALAGGIGRRGVPADADHADLVVNATPIGMAGTTTGEAPPLIDADRLHPGQAVVDLVYHPRPTAWLKAAGARGAATMDGLAMLVHQAAHQLVLWTGQEPSLEAMWRALDRAEPR